MGKTAHECSKLPHIPYKIENPQDEKSPPIFYLANNQTTTPVQISAAILNTLKKKDKNYMGEDVTDVVVTIPAYFDDAQRQATKEEIKRWQRLTV